MILFCNVFITNKGQGLKYDRGLLGPVADRVQVFKYSLASYAVIPWSHVAVYYELEESLKHRRQELDDYIRSLFHNPVIYPYQNEYQDQWKQAVEQLEQINDPLVWFCCNDDHIFIDYELDLLKRMESACQSHLTSTSPFLSFVPTHWPEYVCVSQAATEEYVDYCVCLGKVTNSLQVVSKALLRYWWFEHDYGGAWLPRTDTGTLMHAHAGQEAASKRISISSPDNYPVLVAFRELVRHYDGYSHVSVDPDACPPLRIPEGFFEGKIKIAYGADTAQPGFVLVNPSKNHTSATDPNGADWRCTLEDLPLFWRSRIESVEVNDRLDPDIARRLRNQAVADMATQYYAMPMKKIQIALRFSDQRSPEVEFNALQSFVFKHRLKQHYAEMNLKRTAEGVIESQQLYQWRQQVKNDATPA